MENRNTFTGEIKKTLELLMKEDPKLAMKFLKLCDIIKKCESGVVAFSGGVDSSLLAYLCNQLLGKSLCITADSPTLPRNELSQAMEFAGRYHLNHHIIQHNELEDENFKRNDELRCFYCKDGLFCILNEIKANEGYIHVFDGSNFDDLDDYRPGRDAAAKNNVKSPLLEAELRKNDIRTISKALDLPTWDKPQMACLSSRFPKNIPIDEETLRKIEIAENELRKQGFRDVRVRFHHDMARIEIGKNEEIDLKKIRELVPRIKELGFKYVTLDLEGYRTGSLNK